MGTHMGHRRRMREKYEKYGESVFDTHQLLEMLLFSYVSRLDTNPAAHDLLETVSEKGLFSVTKDDLTRVRGVGNATADGIKLSADTVRRIICDDIESAGLDNEFRLKTYIYLRFLGRKYESVAVIYLSAKDRVLDFVTAPGLKDPAAFSAETGERAKALGAARIIVCHSHGDKPVEPSVEDLYITEYMKNKAKENGHPVPEQYIVSETDCAECRTENG